MKDVNKAEIKQQNRKAMPKFIVIMTLSVLIGGAFGFCTSYYGLNGFAGKLTAAGTYFSSRMAHWLLLALALVQDEVCGTARMTPQRKRQKKSSLLLCGSAAQP